MEIGRIVAVQGIKGELRVEPWCDGPQFLCSFKSLYLDKGQKMLHIEKARPHKNMAVLKLAGFDTPEAAASLRGSILFMDRKDVKLEAGTFFIQDLIGLRVLDADTQKEYGQLFEVSATGANDVYHIKNGSVTYLIPAIPDVVIETDVDGGLMRIRPMKGLFDDED